MARDRNPDLAHWAMYTPRPFSDLFQELGDKVEVFDFEKVNFVTPIMKPEAMAEADAGWITMHGPKIEHKHKQAAPTATTIFGRAGLLPYRAQPPEQMADETEATRLHRVLRDALGSATTSSHPAFRAPSRRC